MSVGSALKLQAIRNPLWGKEGTVEFEGKVTLRKVVEISIVQRTQKTGSWPFRREERYNEVSVTNIAKESFQLASKEKDTISDYRELSPGDTLTVTTQCAMALLVKDINVKPKHDYQLHLHLVASD